MSVSKNLLWRQRANLTQILAQEIVVSKWSKLQEDVLFEIKEPKKLQEKIDKKVKILRSS